MWEVKKKMKGKIIGILVCTMLIAATSPVIATNIGHKVDDTDLFNRTRSTFFEDDVPVWNVNDKWVYKIEDISIDIKRKVT